MHISEGVPELERVACLLASNKLNIIGIHCLEDEKYKGYAVKVVHCPLSNIYLYDKTLRNPRNISAFGSDWPLLVGSIVNQYRAALKTHNIDPLFLLRKATLGGYEIHGMSWKGDLIAFDESFERVIKGEISNPVYVFVNGSAVVKEKSISNLSVNDVDKD